MTMPGGTELIIILFIVLLFFGARKLPDLAGSMGRSIKEFRKATNEPLDEDEKQDEPGSSSTSERDAEH
jgi:sec-independent protein translocase protein TatA